MICSRSRFVAAAAALLVLGAAARAADAPKKAQDPKLVKRGAYLVRLGGCADCHTPAKFDPDLGMPVPDQTLAFAGHPEGAPDPASSLAGHDMAAIGPTFTSFRLPFGVVYTANLTPDAATGLGAWTKEMFVTAVRTGRHMGGHGRPILPPMPWPTLAQQSDADLEAIFAYLHSIPAIRNDVPAPKVPDQAMDGLAAAYEKMSAAHGAPAAK